MEIKPFYRRPAVQTALAALLILALYWWIARVEPPVSATTVMVDLALFGATLMGALALASQFTLPVHSLRGRWNALQRLLVYTIGSRGPVLFVRDGQALESHGERKRHGHGVLLVDHASAAVLRTPTRFTRAVGPGVAFTEPGETLAQALDLRIQTRVLHGSQPRASSDSDSRNPTLAVTEDGIPVSADIQVTFMLDPGHDVAPRSGQFPNSAPYEFSARAAERAVYGETHRSGQPTPWQELPLLMAVDHFREEIENWPLQKLLHAQPNEPPALRQVSDRVGEKVIRRESDSPKQGSGSQSIQILTARGIRVLDVQVRDLKVPEEVHSEHLRRWREEWLTGLEVSLEHARGRAQELRLRGNSEGQSLLLDGITHSLQRELDSGRQPDAGAALVLLVDDARELLQDPTLEPDSSGLRERLSQIRSDLMDGDRAAPDLGALR